MLIVWPLLDPISVPMSPDRQLTPKVTQGKNSLEWLREEEHYSSPSFTTHVVHLHTNAQNCHWHHNGVHDDVCKPLLPNHDSAVLQCSTVFSQRQGRATINAKTLTLYVLKFTKSSGDGGSYCTQTDSVTDGHKDKHRHMLEKGESAFSESSLKPKMKSEVWQSGYQTYKT